MKQFMKFITAIAPGSYEIFKKKKKKKKKHLNKHGQRSRYFYIISNTCTLIAYILDQQLSK